MDEKRSRGRPTAVVKAHKRSMSFPPGLYARLEEIALRDERNVNELIVSMLRESVRRDEVGQPGNSQPEALAA